MTVQILTGDCREILPTLEARSVQTCVTSPPYWGLRDYGVDGQMGLEPSVEAFVTELVAVFREVRRVLRDDGVLWLNLGDSYAGGGNGGGGTFAKDGIRAALPGTDKNKATRTGRRGVELGIKRKDMIGVPWRVAFALQADGWWLRADCIWSKPNAMPESARDRPHKAHDYVFLLSKAEHYFYDADAVRTPMSAKSLSTWGTQRRILEDDTGLVKSHNIAHDMPERRPRLPYPANWATEGDHTAINHTRPGKQRGHGRRHAGFNARWDAMTREEQQANGAHLRTVWEIATHPYPEAHFATFPPKLAEVCIRSGSRLGDMVLDPFGGAGTTGLVADRLGRDAILIKLNPAYADMARKRICADAPLLSAVVP